MIISTFFQSLTWQERIEGNTDKFIHFKKVAGVHKHVPGLQLKCYIFLLNLEQGSANYILSAKTQPSAVWFGKSIFIAIQPCTSFTQSMAAFTPRGRGE